MTAASAPGRRDQHLEVRAWRILAEVAERGRLIGLWEEAGDERVMIATVEGYDGPGRIEVGPGRPHEVRVTHAADPSRRASRDLLTQIAEGLSPAYAAAWLLDQAAATEARTDPLLASSVAMMADAVAVAVGTSGRAGWAWRQEGTLGWALVRRDRVSLEVDPVSGRVRTATLSTDLADPEADDEWRSALLGEDGYDVFRPWASRPAARRAFREPARRLASLAAGDCRRSRPERARTEAAEWFETDGSLIAVLGPHEDTLRTDEVVGAALSAAGDRSLVVVVPEPAPAEVTERLSLSSVPVDLFGYGPDLLPRRLVPPARADVLSRRRAAAPPQASGEVTAVDRAPAGEAERVNQRFQAALAKGTLAGALGLTDLLRSHPCTGPGDRPGLVDFLGLDGQRRLHVVVTAVGDQGPAAVLRGMDQLLWATARDPELRAQWSWADGPAGEPVVLDIVVAPLGRQPAVGAPLLAALAALAGDVAWRVTTAPDPLGDPPRLLGPAERSIPDEAPPGPPARWPAALDPA